jgi:hypothetical protein
MNKFLDMDIKYLIDIETQIVSEMKHLRKEYLEKETDLIGIREALRVKTKRDVFGG